ncbi:AAA family ATPase, partial [Aduncisulcus paluster]
KGSGLKDRIAGHELEVKKVVGDLSLDQAYKDVLTKLEDLVKTQTDLEKAQAQKEAHYRALESDLGALKGKMSQSEEAVIEGKDKLDSALENSIIETMEDLKTSHIEKETLAKRKAAFNAYMESLSILKDRINELDKERAGRNLTEDEWQAMNQTHKDAQTALNEEREKRISLSEKLKSLEAEMKRFESTLKRYAKYEKVQDLVQDLLDLVRGNKFVEFVAVTHLKYIALDASRRLMDITNHRYSLELDTKGNFIIC